MNITHKEQDKHGTTWAVNAAENRFTIVFKKHNSRFWHTNRETYNDPDPAIKAIRRRIEMMNKEN